MHLCCEEQFVPLFFGCMCVNSVPQHFLGFYCELFSVSESRCLCYMPQFIVVCDTSVVLNERSSCALKFWENLFSFVEWNWNEWSCETKLRKSYVLQFHFFSCFVFNSCKQLACFSSDWRDRSNILSYFDLETGCKETFGDTCTLSWLRYLSLS